MNNYYSRIHDLRKELTGEIVERLKSLKHRFIIIPEPDDYEDGAYVMWVDDDGNAFDGRVTKISLEREDGFSVAVKDNYENTATLYSGIDIGCNHVEWLESMLSMLDDLIDGDSWRICSECGKAICEGFVVNKGQEYYCSERCLHKHYTPDKWAGMCHARHLNHRADEEDEGGNDFNYWTTFYQE